MASIALKRYGLESAAKILITVGFLFVLLSWVAAFYYFGHVGKPALLIVPLIFTCVLIILLLVIRYRYTLFEKYPYLMNLPSLFYHIGERGRTDNQSVAFSMIFTVHALVIAFLGLLSLILAISVGSGIHSSSASPFLYAYFAIIAILIVSVLLQYRKIYRKFSR